MLKNEFIKNVAILSSGNAIALIITVVTTPILTRIYIDSELGIFGIFMSLTGWLGVIASLRYDLAVMLPKITNRALKLVKTSLFIALLVASTIGVIVLLFKNSIVRLLDIEAISEYLLFIPVFIFLQGFNSTFTMWQTRNKKYPRISFSNSSRSFFTNGISIGAGLLNFGPLGLILGSLSGLIVNGYLLSRKVLGSILKHRVSRGERVHLLKEYRDLPLKSGPAIFLNLSANQLPLILIGVWFDLGLAGQYYMMQRVLNMPLTIIGKSASQVFFQESNQDNSDQRHVQKLLLRGMLFLFGLIIIPMLLIFIWGKDIFGLVLGSDYQLAGEIASILSIFFLIRFVISSQSTLLITKRKLGVEVTFNLLFLISQVGSLYIGQVMDSPNTGFLLMSISGAVLFVSLGIYLYQLAGKD